MDTFEAILARRSIRRFTAEDVTPEDERTLIEAAFAAPSSNNARPWHFVVVREAETRARLGRRPSVVESSGAVAARDRRAGARRRDRMGRGRRRGDGEHSRRGDGARARHLLGRRLGAGPQAPCRRGRHARRSSGRRRKSTAVSASSASAILPTASLHGRSSSRRSFRTSASAGMRGERGERRPRKPHPADGARDARAHARRPSRPSSLPSVGRAR